MVQATSEDVKSFVGSGDVEIQHCGHPTANCPYLLYINGWPIIAPNSMAWRLKSEANAAAELITSGRLSVHPTRKGYLAAGPSGDQLQIIDTWAMIHEQEKNHPFKPVRRARVKTEA